MNIKPFNTIFFTCWILTFVMSILFSNFASAQKQDTVFIKARENGIYRTDTVFFDSFMRRQIITGTMALPMTQNQMQARNYGLYFSKITESSCLKMVEDLEQGKINSTIETDSTLIVDINITDNCCFAFLCDIAVDSTGTLKLIYHGYGTYCACNCCFGLTYHIAKVKNSKYPKIRAVMINDDRKTLKQMKK